MSNTIELAKSFVPKLDECYRLASLTSVLDGAPELAKQGANANELIIPMMSMDGLADYSRNGGYVQGGVTMTNETVKCNFDRGRRFDVDVMDDLETAGLAFGRLSAQFIRDKVVPELDAFRFASYCGISGVTKKEEALADGAATVAALSAAVTAMDDEEVTATGRYLFITPTLLQGMPYRTGATIKLTVAQTDPRVPEIVTEEPQAVYLYNGVSRSGKPLNYTKTKNPLAGGHWDRALVAAEGDALAADLERYIGKRSGE